MFCEYHKNELYTNFCIAQQCIQPLCPECIDEHIQMHHQEKTQQQLLSIANVKQGCCQKINTTIQILQQQIDIAMIHSTEEQFRLNKQKQLDACKRQIYDIVDNKLNKLTENQIMNLSNTQKIKENSQQVLQELSELLQNLMNNSEMQIDLIYKTCRLDLKSLIDNFTKELDKTIVYPASFEIDDKCIPELESILDKILIKTTHLGQKKQIKVKQDISNNISLDQSFQMMQFTPEKNDKLIEGLTPIRQQSPPPQFIRYDPISINVNEYFSKKCKKPFLPYFKSEDKIMYLSYLDGQVQQINLKIDFNIPKFHKSIVSQHGDVYLLGGVEAQTNFDRRNSQVYCYEPINKKLVKVGSLSKARSSFGVVYSHPYIYCLSGLAPQLTESCERFNIMNNRSEAIPDCNFKAINSIALVFNQNIYKFSNQDGQSRCEFYSQNKWIPININFETPIRMSGAGCQINQSQMIIFGGYDENENAYNESYLIQEDSVIKTHPLPYRAGFLNPQIVAHNNHIYVLQNVEFPFSKGIDEARRKLLCLNNNGWL